LCRVEFPLKPFPMGRVGEPDFKKDKSLNNDVAGFSILKDQ